MCRFLYFCLSNIFNILRVNTYILSVDLGATSGRVILSELSDKGLTIEELHRFPNKFTCILGKYYWNIYELFDHIKQGLILAGQKGVKVSSIGVDTWGVDFVMVAEDGAFLSLPRAYRDPYTQGVPEEFFEIVSREKVYEKTGIQIMNFNSLYQLYAAKKENSTALKTASSILFIPDAISYLLTGNKVCEYTILSTSQVMDPRTKEIDEELLAHVGVERSVFPEIVMPGHVIGELTDELAVETGLGKIPVVAVAGHDTGSAVAAVPAKNERFAYLSSGTWSLMGVEVQEPIVTKESYEMNFTNEGGIEGTTRFLKNITGMWLLEQCRQVWNAEGKDYDYPTIVQMATESEPFVSMVDPDDAAFASPTNMVESIKQYCANTQQAIPATDAAMIRCIFDSLALKYRAVLDRLKQVSPFSIDVLHVIGGGAKNDLLNQLTANAIGLPVVAGPSEATAVGNIMVQAKALGLVDDMTSMRTYIAKSIETKRFESTDAELWGSAYDKFQRIITN